MNEYTKKVTQHYTQFRDSYRSTDRIVFPLLRKVGVKNKTILDFGCGHGVDAMKFVKLGAKKIIGVDVSKSMIDLAKKENNHSKIDYFHLKGKKLPIKNEQVDLVFANFVVHYLADTKQQFKEIARTMKSDGNFVAVFNCLTSDLKFINKRVPMILGKGHHSTKIHVLSKSVEEIKTSLELAGFRLIKFSKISNPDAKIDPDYNNKFGFKKYPVLFLVKKI